MLTVVAVGVGVDHVMLYVYIGTLGFIVLAVVSWQLASRGYWPTFPVWLRWLVELDNPFARANRAGVIVSQLELQPGMAVLDVGCGPGRLTIPVAKEVGPQGTVMAIDLQPGMLRRTKQKAEAAQLSNITYLRTRVGDGELMIDPVDRALLVTVLGEMSNQSAALRQIFDVLKPGGILSVTETVFDPHYVRRENVLQLATDVGFHEKACFGNRLAFTLHLEKPDTDGYNTSV